MNTKLLLCAVGFASFLVTEKAQSQSLTVQFLEISPSVKVNGSFDGNFFMDYPSGISVFSEFQAFCVDPLQSLSYGESVTYEVQDVGDLAGSVIIAKLIGGYLASEQTALDAAAVQWAIWEVVAEVSSGNLSYLDGNVRIDSDELDATKSVSAVATLGSKYLTNWGSYEAANLTFLHSDTHQDVVTWQVVPEPATAGLAALSSLLLFRRRRR